jgi:hypothetical protein
LPWDHHLDRPAAVGAWSRLEGSPEQRHAFSHAHEAIAWRSRVGPAALTVVPDAQPYGLSVAGHEHVDPGRVPCVTLCVGDRLLRNSIQCRLDGGSQIVEIAAVLDIDSQASGSFGGGQIFDVGNPALGEHLRRAVAPAKGPDHGVHFDQRPRRLFLDDFESLGGSAQVARLGEKLSGLCLNGDSGHVMGDSIVQFAGQHLALVESDPLELLGANNAPVADRDAEGG